MARAKGKKLSTRQYISAIFQVAKETYKAAPLPSVIQLSGTVITAVLPIVTTYFAALTTTALADAYVGKEGAGQLAIEYVIITSLLGIILTGWRSLEQYISQAMRYRVEAAMSDRMYEHFLNLDFWRYDDKDTADLHDRAADFSRFFPYVFERVSSLFSFAISAIVSIGALVLVSWWISLIMIVAIIPSIYIQFKLSRMQVDHRNAHVTTRRSKNILEWILGDQTKTAELRLYGVVNHLLTLRRQLRDKDEKARIDFERQFVLKQLGADVLQAVAEISALLFIVVQIIGRQQTIGQFIYVQQVVSRVLSSTNSFVSQLSTLDEDLANLFDYQEFMRLPTRKNEGKDITHNPEHIRIDKVSFHYPQNETYVLNDVSLDIKKGQHVAIVGENGAGKSTLVKILTGLYAPTSGNVLVDNMKLSDADVTSWHKLLAVLQQDSLSYSFVNVKDNVLFGDVDSSFNEDRYNSALRNAESKTFIDKLPSRDKTLVNPWMEDENGNKGTELSGGQWQRLALARNFYRDSPIIILDEPTSAIDALAETRIFNHLFSNRKHTVVTISHRLTTIEKADVIYMLQNGKLIEQGTHAELVAKRGEYYRMFESQLRTK